MDNAAIVFTDGACSGNPGPGGWACILKTPNESVRELGGRDDATTNNRMELQAAIEGLRSLVGHIGPIRIYTDSTYVIGGITSWITGWKRRDWKKKDGEDVANRELWESLDAEVVRRTEHGGVAWVHVRGHSGSPGNDRCDEIAVAYSLGKKVALFDGPGRDYGHDLSRLPENEIPYEKPVYLSLISGELERHSDWPACQARVTGHPRARYKKVRSPGEEKATLKKWGV